jgi:hypothetical protein
MHLHRGLHAGAERGQVLGVHGVREGELPGFGGGCILHRVGQQRQLQGVRLHRLGQRGAKQLFGGFCDGRV